MIAYFLTVISLYYLPRSYCRGSQMPYLKVLELAMMSV